MRRLSVLILAILAGCAGPRAGALPPVPSSAAHQAQDAGPAETANGLPGETANGLPGETANGLPGAQLTCGAPPSAGTAKCTLAINLNVPPLDVQNAPASLVPGLHPADLQAAYRLPSDQTGGTVAVVDAFDDPLVESEMAVYRATFGLPACTSLTGCFRKVNESGAALPLPPPDPAWGQEIALDLEMVSAACPHCSIVLVEANSASLDDLGASVDTAAATGARAISNSYYAAEWSGESTEDAHYQHAGIAITASSGDRGWPSYPAVSQHVTAVGGTSLTGGNGAWNETPWTYGGHGCSTQIAKPWWQAAAPCSTRDGVDVAADADPQTGVALFSTLAGGWVVAGGTSVGAPLVAAAYVLSGNPQGPAYAYWHPWAFRNDGRYDAVDGLGSPLGTRGL